MSALSGKDETFRSAVLSRDGLSGILIFSLVDSVLAQGCGELLTSHESFPISLSPGAVRCGWVHVAAVTVGGDQ